MLAGIHGVEGAASSSKIIVIVGLVVVVSTALVLSGAANSGLAKSSLISNSPLSSTLVPVRIASRTREVSLQQDSRASLPHPEMQDKDVSTVVGTVMDRVLMLNAPYHTDLENVTLLKSGHLVTIPSTNAIGIPHTRPQLRGWEVDTFSKVFVGQHKASGDSALRWARYQRFHNEMLPGRRVHAYAGTEKEDTFQPEHWAGRLSGAPPPTPKVELQNSPPFVILPGFGNADIDYMKPLKQPEEVGFVAALRRRGIDSVHVLPLNRTAWFNVLRGLGDLNFWKGDAQPDGPAYNWYLQKAQATVEKAVAARKGTLAVLSSDARVVLVGHSAGGWLARALCLDETWAKEHIRGIVSLGTPHLGPPPEVQDQTRGTLTNLNRRSPGAFIGAPFFYVTVASDRIVGDASASSGSPAKIAYNSYLMVCGEGAVPGDGTVPLKSAHLDGSTQLTLKCFHSINQPGTTKPTDQWYCAEPFIDEWLTIVANMLQL